MTQDTNRFARLLSSELDINQQLCHVLQQELDCISQQDIRELEALTPLRQNLLNELQKAASGRLEWMKAAGLLPDQNGKEWQSVTADEEIAGLWHDLQQQYHQNQKLTARLSELVLALGQRTRRKLSILLGRQQETGLYDQQGQTRSVNARFRGIRA
ncbi:MAG: hypothetical protein CMI00_13125 [Oceanospirillaceae bacterium]|nr:hypothetical protein [Oceanospirillaceae bacterium]|tara:strand:+ start:829 stop:1299 length:471 start_codon:yes stop_codon:yes gene_type:complete